MASPAHREILIQQLQAETYVNYVRGTLVVLLTGAFLFRTGGTYWSAWLPGVLLVLGWAYVLGLAVLLRLGRFKPLVPWITTALDLVMLGSGFLAEFLLVPEAPSTVQASLVWAYGLLFLLVLFSTLRERPILTLVNGLAASSLYLGLLLAVPSSKAGTTFWADQGFLIGFLLLAGSFSSFHARSVRKAFEQAAASERLRRETDARLKILALHFPGVLFQAEIQGRQFRLRYVSEGCRQLLGWDSRELIAQPDRFFERASGDFLRQFWAAADQEGSAYRSWELEYQYLWGQSTWLKMSVASRRDPEGVLVLNGLVTDFTQQRAAAEALREANQAKTDFLATMSHELRTPLNVILGNAETLTPLAVTDDDHKSFRDLRSAGETLLGLIEDILVFSRLESGRLAVEQRPLAWRTQFETLVDSFRPSAQAKGLSLRVNFPAGAPTWIWSDALRLRQILSNLLANAVKFTARGSIELAAWFEPGTDLPWFVVAVRDTGIGVPAEHQERIFEKFTQGEHGKSRTYGGMGLGLSIGRSLAGLLGGALTVQSRPGEGSEFVLRIPVRTGDTPGETSVLGSDPRSAARTIRVLVVEDNVTNQDVASRMLKKLGVQVDIAPGGIEAVAAAEAHFYDLIFMDWQMPLMDGREATARIRALPGGQDLVIVALSGHALPGDRELLLASGFDDYLSKPVRMDDFRAMIAKWVTSLRGRD